MFYVCSTSINVNIQACKSYHPPPGVAPGRGLNPPHKKKAVLSDGPLYSKLIDDSYSSGAPVKIALEALSTAVSPWSMYSHLPKNFWNSAPM